MIVRDYSKYSHLGVVGLQPVTHLLHVSVLYQKSLFKPSGHSHHTYFIETFGRKVREKYYDRTVIHLCSCSSTSILEYYKLARDLIEEVTRDIFGQHLPISSDKELSISESAPSSTEFVHLVTWLKDFSFNEG